MWEDAIKRENIRRNLQEIGGDDRELAMRRLSGGLVFKSPLVEGRSKLLGCKIARDEMMNFRTNAIFPYWNRRQGFLANIGMVFCFLHT